MKVWLLALFTALVFSSAAAESAVDQKINELIAVVEKSDCTFIRNGSNHNGKDAAAHMRRKYNHFKKEIKSPEDFIEKCASKSELSGKPYLVKTPDGKTVRCDAWLTAKLEKTAEKR